MQILKFILTILVIFIFFIGGLFITALPLKHWKKQKIKAKWIQKTCAWGLFIMGVKINTYGQEVPNASLVVCNHMSYLDVLILTQLSPLLFVTSVELKQTPVLGWLSQVGGCLFVERRSRDNLSKEIKEITDSLTNNQNVVVFPEATSTNAEKVLRFKRPLFNAAIDSGKSVTAICLNYQSLDSVEFNFYNRDLVCWYGDMSFLPHLWALMSIKKIIVDVHVCEVFKSQGESADKLALNTHELISKYFKPIEKGVSNAGASSSDTHWARA